MKTLRKAEELLFEITVVFVRLDQVARFIANANQGMISPAEKLGLADCCCSLRRLAIRADAHRCGVKV